MRDWLSRLGYRAISFIIVVDAALLFVFQRLADWVYRRFDHSCYWLAGQCVLVYCIIIVGDFATALWHALNGEVSAGHAVFTTVMLATLSWMVIWFTKNIYDDAMRRERQAARGFGIHMSRIDRLPMRLSTMGWVVVLAVRVSREHFSDYDNVGTLIATACCAAALYLLECRTPPTRRRERTVFQWLAQPT